MNETWLIVWVGTSVSILAGIIMGWWLQKSTKNKPLRIVQHNHIVAVIAGNYRQYVNFLENVKCKDNFVYVTPDGISIMGLNLCGVVVIGTGYNTENFNHLFSLAKSRVR